MGWIRIMSPSSCLHHRSSPALVLAARSEGSFGLSVTVWMSIVTVNRSASQFLTKADSLKLPGTSSQVQILRGPPPSPAPHPAPLPKRHIPTS